MGIYGQVHGLWGPSDREIKANLAWPGLAWHLAPPKLWPQSLAPIPPAMVPPVPVMSHFPHPRHLAEVPAVLHVDPVVFVVPDAFNAQEVLILRAVAAARERVDEEGLRDLTLARQHQNPRMHPQAVQGVRLRLLCLLCGRGGYLPSDGQRKEA